MVTRMLLAKNVSAPEFGSKKAKDEVYRIIASIKEEPDKISQAFKKAVEIVENAITVFEEQNSSLSINQILRSQKFNQLVKEITATHLG